MDLAMSPAIRQSLNSILLFADLPEAEIHQVEARTRWNAYQRRHQIVNEGDPTTDVFFVASGAIAAKSFSAAGKEVTYANIGAGGVFGEFSAIDGDARSATIIATEPSMIGRMNAGDFRSLLAESPAIHWRVTHLLVQKARELSRRVFEFSTLSVCHRIQAELLRLSETAEPRDGLPVIDPAPTHYEIATRISTHREAVTRELNHLALIGVVELGKRKIIIQDTHALRRSLGGDQLD